jgi:hypothetical protein
MQNKAPPPKCKASSYANAVPKNRRNLSHKTNSSNSSIQSPCITIANLDFLVRMSKKSSTSARIAATASKIKMKRNATRTHCTSDVIHGLAQHYLDMRQPSTFLQRDLTRLIHADTVERISHALGSPRRLPQVIKSLSPQNRIGRYG